MKFVRVAPDYNGGVPEGYELIEDVYEGTAFKVLVPRATLIMYARPGSGDTREGINALAGAYNDIKRIENDIIGGRETNPQEIVWASRTREQYSVWLTTHLTRVSSDGEKEQILFNQKHLKELCLDDPGLEPLLRELAAAQMQVSASELQQVSELSSYVMHVTQLVDEVEVTDILHMRCEYSSHTQVRPMFVKRKVRRIHDVQQDIQPVSELMGKVREYQQKHGRWDDFNKLNANALTRQYINLVYIFPTKPEAQFDIAPP